MVGWLHRPDGHEFEQAPGDGEGQGRLACCSLWGHKELDMTERLNSIKRNHLDLRNEGGGQVEAGESFLVWPLIPGERGPESQVLGV